MFLKIFSALRFRKKTDNLWIHDRVQRIHDLIIAAASAEGIDIGFRVQQLHDVVEDETEVLAVDIGNAEFISDLQKSESSSACLINYP